AGITHHSAASRRHIWPPAGVLADRAYLTGRGPAPGASRAGGQDGRRTRSLAAPGVYWIAILSPAPPSRTSLPGPPIRTSSPSPPRSVSLPSPPIRTSSPSPPSSIRPIAVG